MNELPEWAITLGIYIGYGLAIAIFIFTFIVFPIMIYEKISKRRKDK